MKNVEFKEFEFQLSKLDLRVEELRGHQIKLKKREDQYQRIAENHEKKIISELYECQRDTILHIFQGNSSPKNKARERKILKIKDDYYFRFDACKKKVPTVLENQVYYSNTSFIYFLDGKNIQDIQGFKR